MARDDRELPRHAALLLRLLVPAALREEVAGDLTERFRELTEQDGRAAAKRWLRWQLLAIRPFRMRRAIRACRVASRGRWDGQGSFSGREGTVMWEGWRSDLWHAVRSAPSRPAVTLMVAATVALAVGTTTSVYSVVEAVLLRPLPYPDPDRLVRIWQTNGEWMTSSNSQLRGLANRFPLSVPTFNDWAGSDTGLESIGAFDDARFVQRSASGAEMIDGQRITSGIFDVLAIDPVLGRRLQPADDAPGAPRVAVLSESFWMQRFGGRPEVLGATLVLDDVPHEVVGVVPRQFQLPSSNASVFTPLSDAAKQDDRNSQFLQVVGRIPPGLPFNVVLARLSTMQRGLAEAYPEEQGTLGVRVVSLLDSVVGEVRTTLWFLMGAVGLVLLVATVNIANVMMVSGLQRRRELAVKAALGAASTRLMRALFLESAVLATLGGLGGVLLVWASVPLLVRLIPTSVPRHELIATTPGVIAFGLTVTAATALLVGTLPAIQAARSDPSELMKSAGRSHSGGRRGTRLRSGLVVSEVAVALVLSVGAGLLVNSFLRLWTVDRGFDTSGLVTMAVVPDPTVYLAREDQLRFAEDLRQRLDAIPGVTASATNQVPLAGSVSSTTYQIERLDGEPEERSVIISVGLNNYLGLMGIPLIAGRGFAESDAPEAPPAAIVNETMAREVWPGESPIGKRLRSGDSSAWVEVVGVAADVRHQGLASDIEPKLYLPAAQSGRATFHWVLRVEGDAGRSVDLARRAVTEVSPSTPVRGVQILEETIAASVAVPRFRMLFVVGLAGFAALLALLGIYGVVTFAVSQRTREIGVRMALGARAEGVVAEAVGSGLKLALTGIGVGLLIAWPLARVTSDFLYVVMPGDLPTYSATAVVVLLVSGLAAYVPARRASRVDPVTVLNAE